jgi:hypothetical protein
MSGENDPVHGQEAARFGGWFWSEPRRGEHFRRCSFCGSISPEDLAIEPEWQPEWADRKYGWPHKFYVDIPNQEPDGLFVVSASYGRDEPPTDIVGSGWIRSCDLPEGVNTDGWTREGEELAAKWVVLGTKSHHHAKFYSVHLAAPQLPAEVKETIERRSGLRFRFADGNVAWEGAA